MKSQRGGFVLGLIIGLLVGLALALGVALYIAKVPVPFVNKVPQRTAEQEKAEIEKNKNWDPNGALSNKTPVKTSPPSTPSTATPPPPAVAPPPVSSRDPAAILGDKPATTGTVLSTKPGDEALGGMSYFVQAGAYGKQEDAEQQRAKLAMMGWGAKITEREQQGRLVYRVRVGPFEKREDATQAKEKLEGAGVESALVAIQK
jgi:cell division protein FtsN